MDITEKEKEMIKKINAARIIRMRSMLDEIRRYREAIQEMIKHKPLEEIPSDEPEVILRELIGSNCEDIKYTSSNISFLECENAVKVLENMASRGELISDLFYDAQIAELKVLLGVFKDHINNC